MRVRSNVTAASSPMRGRDGHHQRLPCLNCRDPDRLGVPHESTGAAQTSYMQTSHILNATSRRVHQNRRERRGAVQRQRCRELGLVSRFRGRIRIEPAGFSGRSVMAIEPSLDLRKTRAYRLKQAFGGLR
jgi:hypothetical protein